jgi:hypothetical protein
MELIQTQNRKGILMDMIFNKVTYCLTLSFFSALGTIPYGYRFAEYFGWDNLAFSVVFGSIFAATAVIANMMLGTYSLLNMRGENKDKVDWRVLMLSTIGSIPYGFLCYFGYQNTLPLVINVTISVIVVIVNAGIGYTAIRNLLVTTKRLLVKSSHTESKTTKPEAVFRCLGFVIGVAISLVTYLAACSGITDLFNHYGLTTLVHYDMGYILAVSSWIPCMALFANANQIVAGELFVKLMDFKKFIKGINLSNVAFLCFCLASGTAIAQMTADSFNPAKNIPDFFKIDFIQFLVQHYLIMIAMFSSAALNYFSISKLLQRMRK